MEKKLFNDNVYAKIWETDVICIDVKVYITQENAKMLNPWMHNANLRQALLTYVGAFY